MDIKKIMLKTYFRNFKKHTSTYLITIGGFAVSMAVFILIFTYVMEERGHDKMFPNIDRMYRITRGEEYTLVPHRAIDEIQDKTAEIEKISRYYPRNLRFKLAQGEAEIKECLVIDEYFFELFSISFLQGSEEKAFKSKDELVITRSLANEMFEGKNPIGRKVELINRGKKTVIAVIEDPPENSSLQYEALINSNDPFWGYKHCYHRKNYKDCFNLVYTALLLNPSSSADKVQSKIAHVMENYKPYKDQILELQPYKEVYFDTSRKDPHDHANVKLINLLSWTALTILLLAMLNYINLSIASNLSRFKEVCLRKTSGAKNKAIIRQFLSGSFLSCLISLVIAIGLILLFAPLFGSILGKDFNAMQAISRPEMLFSIIGIYMVVALITGIVPALSASRFNPIELLQPKSRARRNGFRYAFTSIQFGVAIALMIGLIVIQKQIHYVKTKDLGFDSEYLLRVKPEGNLGKDASTIKGQLLDHSNILNVSASGGNLFNITGWSSGTIKTEDREIHVEELPQFSVDKSFIETFQIPLVTGRNFRDSDKKVCIINNKLYKKLGWENLHNKTLLGRKVVGVISDIIFQDIHQPIRDLKLTFLTEGTPRFFNVRIRGTDIPGSLNYIKEVMKEFNPDARINYTFYDDIINRMLNKEEKQASAISLFALIAFILSCLGLYGTAEFVSKYRTKEIGIRKVNGAKTKGILSLLNFDFVKWVALAFIIAVPVAWYAMNQWLQSFAYKTDLSWWIFALAGVIALGIALLTVSWQSWRAARRNPVESLRYE